MKKRTLALLLILALVLTLPALAAGSFTDVEEDAWYAEAVGYCADKGLMEGLEDGTFGPGVPASRAMVVTVLHRLAGNPAQVKADAFADVAEDAWYAQAVGWAATQGITRGRPDGSFAPEEDVSRQDLITFLWRSLGCPAAAEAEPFDDEAEIGDYALEAVRWAKGAGIVNGMGNGCFAPGEAANRAQLASLLMKLDRHLLGESVLEGGTFPCGVTSDGEGGLLVTDTFNKCVWLLKDGAVTRLAGGESAADLNGEPVGGYVDAVPEESLFRRPWAIAPYLNGWAVSDTLNNALRLITETGVMTINASAGEEGLTTSAYGVTYDRPMGLAADEKGNLYVADTGAGAIRVLSPEGVVTTLVSGLAEPTGLCWYGGCLYVAETENHRILRVTKKGTVAVFAGSGEEGYLDGSAKEAQFSSPMGLAVDDQGRVYVADTVNGAVRRIADGQVDTLVMSKPDSPQRWPVSPIGLLVDGSSLYVCDNFTGKLMCVSIG